MNKPELIAAIQQIQGGAKAEITRLLDTLATVAKFEATEGREFVLPGVVKITPITRAARTGRNPHTGQPIEIPAKKAVKLKALLKIS